MRNFKNEFNFFLTERSTEDYHSSEAPDNTFIFLRSMLSCFEFFFRFMDFWDDWRFVIAIFSSICFKVYFTLFVFLIKVPSFKYSTLHTIHCVSYGHVILYNYIVLYVRCPLFSRRLITCDVYHRSYLIGSNCIWDKYVPVDDIHEAL